jgi:hypothetical protein
VHRREALISFTTLRGIVVWYPLRWRDLKLPRCHHSSLILGLMSGTSVKGTKQEFAAAQQVVRFFRPQG